MKKIALALCVLLVAAGAATAHIVATGVGMQTSMKFEPKKLSVEFNLGFSDLTGYEQVLKMETSRDDVVSQEEIDAWLDAMAPKILKALEVTLDKKPVAFKVVKRRVLALFPGTKVKEIAGAPFDTFWNLEAEVDLGPGEHEITLNNRCFEGEFRQTLTWLPRPDPEVFRTFAWQSEPKETLVENHPRDWCLYAPGATIYVEFMKSVYGGGEAAAPVAPPKPPAAAQPAAPSAMEQKAQEAAKQFGVQYRGAEEAQEGTNLGGLKNATWYAALGLALLWGAAHALAPGHGKSMVAAYLLGTEGRIGDAVALGGIITLTHAGSIFIIAIATWFLADRVFHMSQAAMHGYSQIALEVVSGFLVALMGVGLFLRRIRQYRRGEALEDHHHGPGAHHHHHGDDHGHDHDDSHGHAHSHGGSEKGDLLSLGFAAGLQPCTAGLALVFISIEQQWLWKGIYVLLAFSLGLGLVLVAIAVSMVIGKQVLADQVHSKEGRFLRTILPMVSASALALVGLWMMVDCLRRNQVWPFA